jgi:hypothetical protein
MVHLLECRATRPLRDAAVVGSPGNGLEKAPLSEAAWGLGAARRGSGKSRGSGTMCSIETVYRVWSRSPPLYSCDRAVAVPPRSFCGSVMPPRARSVMVHWSSAPTFLDPTVGIAGEQMQEILPHYPHPSDQPIAICVNGYRWFASEVEALADAIHRAARRPNLHHLSLAGPDWEVEKNRDGLWAVPGHCSPQSPTSAFSTVGGADTALVQSKGSAIAC